jgi:hypothetical protein|tara:strand:- start:3693 stop:4151 length:459 start_codon:yes stop_codon:yes gene_type:complete
MNNIFETYTSGLKDNLFIVTKVIVKDNKGKFHINTSIPQEIFLSIIDFSLNFDNLKFVCRANHDDNAGTPNSNQITLLRKYGKIFFQDPWPTPVPNFKSDSVVFRFGYDEGCEYDKMCAHNPIHNVEENDGTYYYLISKNNIVKLESKKILI